MTQVKSGLLLEHCCHAIFLEAKMHSGTQGLSAACTQFCSALQALQQQFPDARLGAIVAFSPKIWQALFQGQDASELKPFVELGQGLAPATQRDLLIHIQALRNDVCYSLSKAVMTAFGPWMHIQEETHGFRWVEERDLSGFIDGTENPQGEDRAEVATIAGGNDDAGGSYVMTQRYVHDLTTLQAIPLKEQEHMMGRTRDDNQEIPGDQRPDSSHLSRVDLKEQGQSLKILSQSLPYGKVSGEHGLYFIAYCARLHNIEQKLLSMFGLRDSKTDQLLRFGRAVTGSYYFSPSLTRLLAL